MSSGTGLTSGGSSASGITGGHIFSELRVVTTLVSDAFADPATTPTVDTLLWQYDVAGNVAQFLYVVPLAAWKGVQVG